MLRSLFALLAFIALLAATPPAPRAQEPSTLRYLTEEYYPYNFSANGTIQGLSADLLRLIWHKMGVPEQPITILPWARAYEETLLDPGTVLFSMARTPEREHLFRWVGPIDTVRFVLFALASNPLRLEDATGLDHLSVGTVRGDVADLSLRALRRPIRIEPVADMKQNLRKLDAGRLDLVAYEERSMRSMLAEQGLDPERYKSVFLLKETDICYALHYTTSPALVIRFQQALDAIRASEDYAALLKKYLK